MIEAVARRRRGRMVAVAQAGIVAIVVTTRENGGCRAAISMTALFFPSQPPNTLTFAPIRHPALLDSVRDAGVPAPPNLLPLSAPPHPTPLRNETAAHSPWGRHGNNLTITSAILASTISHTHLTAGAGALPAAQTAAGTLPQTRAKPHSATDRMNYSYIGRAFYATIGVDGHALEIAFGGGGSGIPAGPGLVRRVALVRVMIPGAVWKRRAANNLSVHSRSRTGVRLRWAKIGGS